MATAKCKIPPSDEEHEKSEGKDLWKALCFIYFILAGIGVQYSSSKK